MNLQVRHTYPISRGILTEFYGRERELALLNDLYHRKGAQFLIVYGRRRIGKTRLVTWWLEKSGLPSIYWMATQTSAVNQLRNFSQTIFQFLNPEASVEANFSYTSWDAAFVEVGRAAAGRRLVLVLDEFTYVIQALLARTDKVLPGKTTWRIRYIFFARDGFTPQARALAKQHNARLVELSQIESDMRHWLRVQAES